jgi:response regulator RpfG family c-di-GMP phosphodiesterase/DNA-binding CsgD family transcriptional regulator
LRLAELAGSLSLATDLGLGHPLEQALRSSLLATDLGRRAGLGPGDLRVAYYLSLLRLIGCTSTASDVAALLGDDRALGAWFETVDAASDREAMAAMLRNVGKGEPPLRRLRRIARLLTSGSSMREGSRIHCEVGRLLCDELHLPEEVRDAFGQMFERWDGHHAWPGERRGDAIHVGVRLVHLAGDLVTFDRLQGRDGAVAVARRRSGTAYDPALVDLFCDHADDVLDALHGAAVWAAAMAAEPEPVLWLDGDDAIDDAARAIGDFADLKSPFFVGHSRAVAELAADAAAGAGLAPPEVMRARRAGWLHDVGRTGVSNAVWEKPGPLTDGEWEQVRLHPYYTERVLVRAGGLSAVARVAAAHHERADGTGYPKGLEAGGLQPVAAILAAADSYRGLVEDRPHRPGAEPAVAAAALRDDVVGGRLDGGAVDAVLRAAGHRSPRARPAWPAGLTEREVDVLARLARGMTNRKVAADLGIAEKTVGNHIEHVYQKIGVSTRAAATLFALQHDLVER